MDALVIEAVPPGPLRALSIALEIFLAVVGQHVVLTWHEVDLFRRRSFQCLVQRVEFTRLRELTQIAGVNNEIWFVRHGIELVDCRLQSGGDIRIGWLGKADMTVADLHKAEVPAFAGMLAIDLGEGPRWRGGPAHRPDQACACPCHALEESTTVDAVVVKVLPILINSILLFVCHLYPAVSNVLSS